MADGFDINAIIERTMRSIVEEAMRGMFNDHWDARSDVFHFVREEMKSYTKRLLAEDTEMQQLIRDAAIGALTKRL